VVSVTSDVASSVPVSSTPSKSTKPQAKTAGNQFGALVDSNTDAASTQTADPVPRRTDAAKASDKGTSDKTISEKTARDNSASDQTSQSNDPADDTAPTDKTAAADSDKGPAKTKDKSDTSETKSASKPDESKSEQADETDGLAAAVQAADATQQQVAGLVAEGVVDPLEAVQVQIEHRQ